MAEQKPETENVINLRSLMVIGLMAIIKLCIGFFIYMLFYPIAAMICFGEGSGSFLYSKTNEVIWIISPLLAVVFKLHTFLSNKGRVNLKHCGK